MTRRRVVDEVVIHPSFRTYRGRLATAAVLVFPAIGLQLWQNWHTEARLPLAAFWLIFVVVFVVLMVAFFRREEIKLAGGKLTRWNLLGIARTYPVDEIGGMARRDVDYPFVARPTHYVVVYDRHRRCLFKMNRPFWSPGDIVQLHSFLGGVSAVQRVSVRDLEEEFPGSFVWPLRHPFVTFVVEFLVIATLIVGVVALQDRFIDH